jgi:hypothetical protein
VNISPAPRPKIALPIAIAAAALTRLRNSPASFLAAAANVATAAGIIFAVVQYRGQAEATRTQQSLEYIEKWEDGGYLNDYEMLQSKLTEILNGLTLAERKFVDSAPASGKRTANANVGRATVGAIGEKGQETVDKLFYFFNKIAICVNYSLCSKSATDVFFREAVESFWIYFGWYAEEKRRTGYPTFAREIETYLGEDTSS